MAILLGILRIIGCILLVLLILVVLLLAVVLLVPIRYRACVRFREGTADAEGEISWLLRVIRVPFTLLKELPGKKDAKRAADTEVTEAEKKTEYAHREPGLTWNIRIFRFSLKKFLNKDQEEDRKTEDRETEEQIFEKRTLEEKTSEEKISEEKASEKEISEGETPAEEVFTAGTSEAEIPKKEIPKKEIPEGEISKVEIPEEEAHTEKIPKAEIHIEKPERKELPEAERQGKKAGDAAGVMPESRRDPEKRMREGAKRKPSVKPGERAEDRKKPDVTVEITKSVRPGPFEMRLAKYGALIGKIKKALRRGESVLEVVLAWLDYTDSESFRKAVSLILQEVKAMLKHILPRRLEGTVEYGFGDPALTGGVLGGIAAFYPVLPPKLSVIPYFEEKKLETDTEIRGHITIGVLLFRALKLVISKDVRDLVSRIRAKSPEDPEIRRSRNREKKKAAKKAKRAAARKRKQKKKKRMGKGGCGHGR